MTIATERSSQTNSDQLIILKGDWAHFQLIKQGCEQNLMSDCFILMERSRS